MQRSTFAAALVAGLAYANTTNEFEVSVHHFSDHWANVDMKVEWFVNGEQEIGMGISGTFSTSEEAGPLTAANGAKAQWYFCWNDTDECFVTKVSDEADAGVWLMSNWVVTDEEKNDHSGNDWPEYLDTTDYY